MTQISHAQFDMVCNTCALERNERVPKSKPNKIFISFITFKITLDSDTVSLWSRRRFFPVWKQRRFLIAFFRKRQCLGICSHRQSVHQQSSQSIDRLNKSFKIFKKSVCLFITDCDMKHVSNGTVAKADSPSFFRSLVRYPISAMTLFNYKTQLSSTKLNYCAIYCTGRF